MSEIERRKFIKAGIAVIAGVAVETAVLPIKIGAAIGVEKLSNQKVGNASVNSKIEEDCEDDENKEDCSSNFRFSDYERFQYQLGLPVSEELLFRAIPSYILSKKEGADNSDAAEETLRGTGGFKMTRREMIWGGVTSALFAAVHGITPKGFDASVIPAPQFIGGLSNWYLQRKFGIIANISAHAFNNSLAIWVSDNLR